MDAVKKPFLSCELLMRDFKYITVIIAKTITVKNFIIKKSFSVFRLSVPGKDDIRKNKILRHKPEEITSHNLNPFQNNIFSSIFNFILCGKLLASIHFFSVSLVRLLQNFVKCRTTI